MQFRDFERGAQALVQMTLPGGDQNTAMMFTLVISGNRFHWIVYRPTNYTQVWTDHPGAFAKWSNFNKEDRIVTMANGVQWSGIQDHDTCWTDWACNVVGLDFMTDVTLIDVTVFTADPMSDYWTHSDAARRGIMFTLTENNSYLNIPRTGRKVLSLSVHRTGDKNTWFGMVFDLVLAYWSWKGHKVETLVAAFDCHDYKGGRATRLFRELHYKIEDGKPVLVGVASDRRGEKIVPRKGTGSIEGDVAKHVVVPMKLESNPGRELSLETTWSKMDPKPASQWPHY